jgi:CRP-like cAMP-binding protein
VQVHQQREERARLKQLVDRSGLGDGLGGAEEAMIVGLWRTARHHPSNSRIEAGEDVRLITSGWAGWLRCADDGRRLIFLFLMPGDFIVPGLFTVRNCDLVSLTPVRTVDASALIQDGGAVSPKSSQMIHASGLRYRHLLLDHMTRLMVGSTTSSIALLLTEFHERSLRAGACIDGRFSLPIGQRMLAAALGRSAVQVNKVISKFQTDGLIRVGYDWLQILDLAGLESLSGLSGKDFGASMPHQVMVARG